MSRFPRLILVLIGILILTSGCSQQTLMLKPLNKEQVDTFVKDKSISPVVVEDVGDSYTVIGFENQSHIGYYAVAINKDGDITSHGSITDNSKSSPVWLGGSGSGIPFVTIIINDKNLLAQADKVLVRFNDGYEVSEDLNSRKGIVISDDRVNNSNVGVALVQILDATGKLLFDYPWQ